MASATWTRTQEFLSALHLLSPLTQFMRCFREHSRTRLGSGNYSAVTGFTSLLSVLYLTLTLYVLWGSEYTEGRIKKARKFDSFFSCWPLQYQLCLRSGQDRLGIWPGSVTHLWIHNTTASEEWMLSHPCEPAVETKFSSSFSAWQWQRFLSFPLRFFLDFLVDKFITG